MQGVHKKARKSMHAVLRSSREQPRLPPPVSLPSHRTALPSDGIRKSPGIIRTKIGQLPLKSYRRVAVRVLERRKAKADLRKVPNREEGCGGLEIQENKGKERVSIYLLGMTEIRSKEELERRRRELTKRRNSGDRTQLERERVEPPPSHTPSSPRRDPHQSPHNPSKGSSPSPP